MTYSWIDACRSLRGNVDRNRLFVRSKAFIYVVPYVGTWIEMMSPAHTPGRCRRRSLRGNVDRNFLRVRIELSQSMSFPTWERG